jgi:cellulose synthase/poly-beta-1,6-N-acetylglucosamine synthase-like glycosyltransferase
MTKRTANSQNPDSLSADDVPAEVSSPARPVELAVVLPAYNERANVAPMLAALETALAGIEWEVIYVDDNSPDGTAEAVRKMPKMIGAFAFSNALAAEVSAVGCRCGKSQGGGRQYG